MNNLGFTPEELVPYLSLFVLMITILVISYAKGYKEVWSPLSVTAIIFGYYCLLGPFEAVRSGDTFDRLLNMRPFYVSSFYGALIFLVAICAGFVANNRKAKKQSLASVNESDEVLFKYGRAVVIIGFLLFTISTGGNVGKLINPFEAEYVQQVGGNFSNYLNLSINFLIPGVTMLFLYYLRTKKGFWLLLIAFLISIGIYTTLGFRYRLVLLAGSLYIVYYLNLKKRPNLILMAVGVFCFIAFMGLINLTRNYGIGLNLNRLEKNRDKSFYRSGLEEAQIFQTSGAIIELVPSRYPHAGIQPIISTIFFPIPKSFLDNKNSAQYLFDALDFIYGKKYSKGAAILAYGEYYLAFGWLGVILGGLIIGWYYKKLWIWYKATPRTSLAIVAYAVTVSYSYVIFSRGYLPQVTMLFFFSVFPVYVVIWLVKRKDDMQPKKIVLHRAV